MEDKKILRELLLKQYDLYPKMQIQDMVKFIYQNEFAGGHMIRNQEDSLDMLKRETQALYGDDHNGIVPVTFEEIGNGLCRLHLTGPKDKGIDIKTINKFFVNTAGEVNGNLESFKEKLEIFQECCESKVLPYSLGGLEGYLKEYKMRGYPLVSHSDEYRVAYSPAYPIVKDEYRHYSNIFSRIDVLLNSTQSTINIAIDGNSGSGKSTLSNLIEDVYDCNIFHMDDFFLRPEQRTDERLKEVGGNVDYVRFNQEVMVGIARDMEFQYRPYNCQTMALEDAINVKPKRLNIIEGVYSMHPTLVHNYDLKIFLYLDEDEQSHRILKRNGAFMHKRFIDEWIPMENKYFDKKGIIGSSDLVFRGYM